MRYAFLLILILTSCQRETNDLARTEPSESTTISGTFAPATSGTIPPEQQEPSSRPSVAPPAQDVHLIEYQIHMPETMSPGRVAFKVANGGKEKHGFEIEGNGIEEKTQILSSGDTAELTIELRPGTYTVYCPVEGHNEKGMSRTLKVQ